MNNSPFSRLLVFLKNEDWLAVFIAFLIVLLSVVGLLGPHGLQIAY